MSPRRTLLLGAALALLGAAPAAAAQVEVKAVDAGLTWDRTTVPITAGDTVVWSFAGTAEVHNVAAETPNWSYASVPGKPAPNGMFTFEAPGVYGFVCQVHSGMQGTVEVSGADGSPPPAGSGAPPPPPGQLPLPSDMPEPGPLETGGLDATGPSVSGLRLRRSGAGARISLRVSERARVTVRLVRAGKVVRTRHARGAGRLRLTVGGKGLAAGRYRVEVTARDVAGNASAPRRGWLTLR